MSTTDILFKITDEFNQCEVSVTVDFIMEHDDEYELTKALRRTLAEQFHVPMKCVEVGE